MFQFAKGRFAALSPLWCGLPHKRTFSGLHLLRELAPGTLGPGDLARGDPRVILCAWDSEMLSGGARGVLPKLQTLEQLVRRS